MSIIINLWVYIKGIVLFKKGSYLILSFILTLFAAVSKPITEKTFEFLKSKLDTEDVILIGLIAMAIFIVIFIVITVDTIFGLMAAKYEGQNITTAKGLSSVFKMIFYSTWIVVVMVFQLMAYISEHEWILSTINYVMFFSAMLIVLWEVRSIGNNMERRFGKQYAFFTLIDKVIDILERKIGSFLENTICRKNDT